FDCAIGIPLRVQRDVSDELRTDYGSREAAQIDTRVSELLCELRGNTRPVTTEDPNRVHGVGDVEAHLRGHRDFPVPLQRRDEQHPFAGAWQLGVSESDILIVHKCPESGRLLEEREATFAGWTAVQRMPTDVS